MKKKFTFLMAALMLLTMILPWKAVGQEKSTSITYTFSSKSWGASNGNWSGNQDGNALDTKGVQCLKDKTYTVTSPVSYNSISQVVVTYGTASSTTTASTVSIKVGTGSSHSQNVAGGSQSGATLTYNLSPNESGSVVMEIKSKGASTYIKSVKITYVQTRTITFHGNGGTYSNSDTYTQIVNDNEATNLTANQFVNSGYTFKYWTETSSDSGTTYADESSITLTANKNLYAQWQSASSPNIIINGGTALALANTASGAQTATVQYNNMLGYSSPSVALYNDSECTLPFTAGWLTASLSGEGSTTLNYSASANTAEGERTVYIKVSTTWNEETITSVIAAIQDPAEFTITFHGNNGKTADNDEEYTQTNVVYGIATALTANEFTRDGYFFNSWNTEADGSGDDSYIDQDEVTLTSDLDLYAQWTIIPTYTLVTDVNQIVPGAHYLIVSSITAGGAYAMGSQNSGQYRNRDDVKIVDNSGTISITKEGLYEFVLSGYAEENTYKWTFYDKTNAGYLYASSSSKNYLETQSTNDDNGNWSIEIDPDDYTAAIVAQGTNTKNKIQHNSSATRFSCYSTDQGSVYLYKKDNDTNIEFYSDSKIAGNLTVDQNLNLTNAITIDNGGALNMGSNTLSIGTGGSLTIEDGGQLILRKDHPAVSITAQKTVAAPATWNADTKTGWYAISSTVGDITDTDLGDVTNLTPATVGNVTQYDLYKYVEGQGWINQHAHNSDFGGLQNGHGYLYARKEDATLSFSGNVTTSDVVLSDLTADGTGSLKGIHFIGNPFTHNIYKSVAVSADAGSGHAVSTGFYKLNESSQWVAVADNAEAIKPGQGFLVEVTAGTTLTIKNDASVPAGKSNNDYIRFTVANSHYEDVAYAWFDKGLGLGKVNHRNNEAPMLYINQNGNNYAIATMDDNTESFNLNFKAMATGRYTLGYDTKGNYSYLHIIDRMTGEDVDMLMEDKYSFIGSPQDNAERFIVKLSYNNGSSTGSEAFAYQSGNEIIVNGEGTLEVYDVTGRKVMTTTINGVQTVNGLNNGFYIFRLNEKTQKIVVK